MPERSFFEMRYSLPGYTFLLMIVLICLPSILVTFSKDLQTGQAILGIVFYFLSGPAIGFLVSQVWYLFFWWWPKYGRSEKSKLKHIEFLQGKLGDTENRQKVVIASDYLVHKAKNDALKSYLDRRWDLINVMASVAVATGLGITFGAVIETAMTILSVFSITRFSPFYEIVIGVIGAAIVISLVVGYKRINAEYNEMVCLLLRDVKDEDIKTVM